jgi:hypothetical protein
MLGLTGNEIWTRNGSLSICRHEWILSCSSSWLGMEDGRPAATSGTGMLASCSIEGGFDLVTCRSVVRLHHRRRCGEGPVTCLSNVSILGQSRWDFISPFLTYPDFENSAEEFHLIETLSTPVKLLSSLSSLIWYHISIINAYETLMKPR